MTLQHSKKELRREILSLRRSLSFDKVKNYSSKIMDNILSWTVYKDASVVMAFASMADEVQTKALLEDALAKGKKLCIPYIVDLRSGIMQAVLVEDLSKLVCGKAGILSSRPEEAVFVSPEEIDLIIVPGAAFSPAKYRLGLGGGFYDRFLLKTSSAVKAGVFFDMQKKEYIPVDKYDVCLDVIFTEKEILK